MNFEFKPLQSSAYLFFDILPKEWQDEIVPFWTGYEESADIYIIEDNNHIIGGGIVFATTPPDILYFKEEAKDWFDNGYLYIGFLWIAEVRRDKNLGSYWLDQLKKIDLNQKYWLLIEEERLHRFYQRNGFLLNKTIIHEKHPEWLYSYAPVDI